MKPPYTNKDYYLRDQASRDCVAEIAHNITARDKGEITYLGWSDATSDIYEALITSIDLSSNTYSLYYKDQCLCVFGDALILDYPIDYSHIKAHVWLISSVFADDHPKYITQLAKIYISQCLTQYHHLTNVIASTNTASIKWLEFLGFTFQYPKSMREPCLIPFYMNRQGVQHVSTP